MIVVLGAGGFIGGHLVERLIQQGDQVRAVDLKPQNSWYQLHSKAENLQLDLRHLESCHTALAGCSEAYNLAADMGGMGFIATNKALCMLNVLINTHLLQAAKSEKVNRYFFASSACVYNEAKQNSVNVLPLKEEDAYPAMPEDGYGWEKLFSERMCRNFSEDFGLLTRVARFHNVYGPYGSFNDGREKAPAAICRKVNKAKQSDTHQIKIWGDGTQTRSFTYVDDCIDGILKIMKSDIEEPLNLGSSELVTINELVDMVEKIADVTLKRVYDPTKPRGVMGRNSDNTKIKQLLGWEPSTSLKDGLPPTYEWISSQASPTRMLETADHL